MSKLFAERFIMFLKFDPPVANDSFVSVMIMSYFRPEFTLELLRSIHQNADMPFEIILHDDHSPHDMQDKIFREMKMYCSTMVFGQGEVNMGFNASANRGTALCNSDYVILINNDCLMTGPCFKLIKDVLDIPYIGCFGPRDVVNPPVLGEPNGSYVSVNRNGRQFGLGPNASGSGVFAYKKSTWEKIGGFPQAYMNGGDISFMFSLLRHGYFHGHTPVLGNTTFRNIDQENGTKDTTSQHRNYDQSYPRVFPYCLYGTDWVMANLERRHRRYPESHQQYLDPAGMHNIDYWHRYFVGAQDGQYNYDWSKLTEWGQAQWKDQIEADIAAWKALKNA